MKHWTLVIALSLLASSVAWADEISPDVIYKHDSARLATWDPSSNTTVATSTMKNGDANDS